LSPGKESACVAGADRYRDRMTAALPGKGPDRQALAAVARGCLADGGSADQAVRAVLERTRSPIAAIKAMREALPGLSLAEAKPLVHRNLPPGTREAAEKLWDDMARAAAELVRQPDEADQ
jgi:ribosomal protein L7/L12